jgi:hypothetical protein
VVQRAGEASACGGEDSRQTARRIAFRTKFRARRRCGDSHDERVTMSAPRRPARQDEHASGAEFRFSPRPNRAAEIEWRPWGEAAFAEARRRGRPVLLSLSAVWCHWCHVMDETSYSDPRIIASANRDYVPVRVDNDRDPDVNRRYNMGGWPTTAFLTAGGEVITGATYLPPDDMAAALDNVRAYFDEHRDELAALDGRRAA